MTRKKSKTAATALGVVATSALVLGVAACGDDDGTATATPGSTQPGSDLPQGSEPANLDPTEFTTEIDNPYFPMTPGSRWIYREFDNEGTELRVDVKVTNQTKTIANGVEARVIRDVVSDAASGERVEVTDDWYAQDSDGNVWYLGEDTAEYKNGHVTTRSGSFEAGVDGAEAGIIMPAQPEVGMAYRQEYYAGEAEDKASVLSIDEQVQVPTGYYDNAVMTKDLVPPEPKVSEHKFFAPGVGLVLSLKISGGSDREELISFHPGS